MTDLGASVTTFLLLCGSAGLARHVRPRLPETFRTRETIETMQLVIGMLVTFAALVLGLLTASVKSSYDTAARDRHAYALELTQLDGCLRDYGPGGDAARADITSYTAAVIASTWPGEKRPEGVTYPDTSHMPVVGASPVLRDLLDRAGLKIRHLDRSTPELARAADDCAATFRDVIHARLTVVEDANASLSRPFFGVLVFWLMAIFVAFGLAAPRNTLALFGIVLCAFSLSTAIFVITDLSRPYSGWMSISSRDMRVALAFMVAPGGE